MRTFVLGPLGFDTFVYLDERENDERHDDEGNECFHTSYIVDVIDAIFFNDEVINNELLAFGSVLSHVIRQ